MPEVKADALRSLSVGPLVKGVVAIQDAHVWRDVMERRHVRHALLEERRCSGIEGHGLSQRRGAEPFQPTNH